MGQVRHSRNKTILCSGIIFKYLVVVTFLISTLTLPIYNSSAATTIYYVDSTNGSDSYDGESPETPWKTIGHVNIQNFDPGDAILFKRGEIWRETLVINDSGDQAAYITFGAYGTGEKPIISGAELITSWNSEGGDVWSAPLDEAPYMVFVDDIRGEQKSSIGDLSQERDWCWVGSALYLYTPYNPEVGYESIESLSNPKDGIDMWHSDDNDYVIIRDLCIRDISRYGIRINDSSNSIITNLTIETIGRAGIAVCVNKNLTISNNTITAPSDYFPNQTDGIFASGNQGNIYEHNYIVINNLEPLEHSDCIQMLAETGATVRYNRLEQHTPKGANSQGLYCTYSYGSFLVHNNIIYLPNSTSSLLGVYRDQEMINAINDVAISPEMEKEEFINAVIDTALEMQDVDAGPLIYSLVQILMLVEDIHTYDSVIEIREALIGLAGDNTDLVSLINSIPITSIMTISKFIDKLLRKVALYEVTLAYRLIYTLMTLDDLDAYVSVIGLKEALNELTGLNLTALNNTVKGQSYNIFRTDTPYVASKNNIFINTAGYTVSWFTSGVSDYSNIDNNIYYTATDMPITDLSSRLTFSDWQILGADNNSFVEDPVLGEDFKPLFGSPAIDNGLDVSDITGNRDILHNYRPIDGDRDGNAKWDIGPFEYGINTCPMLMLDLDGNSLSDIVIDFGPDYGIWAYMNNSSWERIHNLSCASMQKADLDEDPRDELIIDFGTEHGIWILYNNRSWSKLHDLSCDQIISCDVRKDNNLTIDDVCITITEVVFDFGEHGIWLYEYIPNHNIELEGWYWTQIHELNPESLDIADDEVLVVDFGSEYGVWALTPDPENPWMFVHPLSPELIETADINNDGTDEGIFDFGEYGIWIFNADISEWTQLHVLSPESITALNIDGQEGKDLVIDFGSEYGIWVYYNGSSWNQLHPVSPKWIIGGNLDNDENKKDDLVIDFGPEHGIWKNENQSPDWQKIHDLSV